MMYDWKEAIRRAFISEKEFQEQMARDIPECGCDVRMWQAAANLTTAEYSRAIRVRKLTPQGLNNRGTC
jgi:hypothetical protein